LNTPGKKDVVSEGFLQNKTVLLQLIKDKQSVNSQYLENARPSEKPLVMEKQASLLEIGKGVPEVAANTVQSYSPVDNRADSPAITKPLTHPSWSKDLGEQIVWINNKAISAAEIRLNPAHLGPISVRIDINNQDQATIMFTAQHASVKEAIEASIPKLREMLATQQLDLVNVNISQNSTSDQGRSHYHNLFNTPENHQQGIDGAANTLEKTENDGVVSKGILSIYA
jgi:flagellar hook-length control protein FliK